MIGTIGVDLQRFRATIVLMEWTAGTPRYGSVGDGRRTLVPLAATETLWGSPAAEAALAALPTGMPLARSLHAWRQDPWRPEFLTGLRARLARYLGQAPLAAARTHQLSACVDPAERPADAADQLDVAGLPAVELVDPLEALLCRWLSAVIAPVSGPVVVVAIGEATTQVGVYTVDSGPPPSIRPGTTTRLESGCVGWTTAVATRVLGLCRPGVPPRALLALLDGVDEFAALVRNARTDDAAVEWTGPLSRYMFNPLRTTRRELATDRTITDVAVPIVATVRRVLSTVAGPATVVVGGPGAAWPFVAGALAGSADVWSSGDPLLDFAVGASWWVPLRSVFRSYSKAVHALAPTTQVSGEDPGPTLRRVPAEPWDVPVPARGHTAADVDDGLLPWERA